MSVQHPNPCRASDERAVRGAVASEIAEADLERLEALVSKTPIAFELRPGQGRHASFRTLHGTRLEENARHCTQESQIVQMVALGHMLGEDEQVDARTAVVELGAGKATLARHVQRALRPTGLAFVLVDITRFRKRADYSMRGEGARKVVRLVEDLARVDLAAALRETDSDRMVAVAKHLCGVATDLGIAALDGLPCAGVAIATCCHWACQWDAYVGRAWLESLGFDAASFAQLAAVSAWATPNSSSSDGGHAPPSKASAGSRVTLSEQWTVERRRELGLAAKAVIDEGRARHLAAQAGFAQVKQYAFTTLSLENRLLVASATDIDEPVDK